MARNDERRVLNRTGARELSRQECEQVNGAFLKTGVCTIDPKTCAMDGDCPVPIGC